MPLAAMLLVLWLVPSLDQICKYLGAVGLVAAVPLAFAAILIVLTGSKRYPDLPSGRWFVAMAIALIAACCVLYPLANGGLFGPGSDRDDALAVGLQAMLHGRSPYSVTTYLGNPPTPMPGALLLALPFHLLGNAAWQNVLWGPVFVFWCRRSFATPAAAVLAASLFLAASPGPLADFVVGGDYFVNLAYVAIAAGFVISTQNGSSRPLRLVALLGLGVALSSRPIYLVVPVVLAGYVYRAHGAARAAGLSAIAAATFLAITAPFYLLDPASFPTGHLQAKLAMIPAWLVPQVLLPVQAVTVAGLAFFVRPLVSSAALLTAAALAMMLVPPILFQLAAGAPWQMVLGTASYTLPVSLFAGLGLLWRWEPRRDSTSP